MSKKNNLQKEESFKDIIYHKLKDKDLGEKEVEEILRIIRETAERVPKVGIFGKTGVGKSELCNALFGKDVAEVSDIESCTKNPEEYLLEIADDHGIKLIDVPGIGESIEKDKKYEKMYSKLLPELDVVLWVLKADARSYTLDEHYFKKLIKPNLRKVPLILVLNQIDKIEPYREWDTNNNVPSDNQKKNIWEKVESVYKIFGIEKKDIVATSASDRWGLKELVNKIIKNLPDDKKFGFFSHTRKENHSEESRNAATQGFFRTLKDGIANFFEENINTIIAVVGAIGLEIIRRYLESLNGEKGQN